MALRFPARLAFASLAASLTMFGQEALAQAPQGLDKLSHILVLYLENRSFDNLFGEFPKANGIANAGEAAVQRDRDGKPYETLPPLAKPFDIPENPKEIRDIAALDGLPNKPFPIPGVRPGVVADTFTKDPIHAFYTNRTQIHGGRNDWFAAYSDVKALAMGYYPAAALKDTNLWKLAERYTLLDNFFMGAFGGSFFNHHWLICACAPAWPDPPKDLRSQVDGEGHVVAERRVTAAGDGDHAVNTTQSIFLNNGRQGANLLPPQTATTIGDRLTEKGIDWAWYSGGWDLATAVRTPEQDKEFSAQKFQWHHQPFAYYERFSPLTQSGRDQRLKHLRDASRLEADIKSGALPAVSFYKPVGVLNQHAGYASLIPADEEVGRIVKLMEESPMKGSYAVVITYDENGGFWDHVAPPMGAKAGPRADFFGPGSRIPTIVASPFARKGVVDHTEYETTSILRLIGERHRLNPLPSARYGAVESLAKAFDFGP
ncbi:MAG TPA: alkaline phosphatase family protein [Beijerinckiaceae bacterium]|jgi:phospholipase C